MAEQVTKLYAKLKPLIIADVAKMGRGGGGATVSVGVLTPHALDNLTIHTGQLARSQALWVAEDIAAHAALPDVHHPRASGAAGVSVDASSQQVSLNRAPTSGLTITSDQVAIGTPTTSSSTSANAVTADSHSHAVIAHTDGLANPSQLAKFHSDGGMSFGRVTTPLITTASGNLTLTPAGRVDLTAGKEIRTTDSVTGLFGAGWRMTNVAGHGFLDIREIQVEELRAYLFMADFVRVQIGEDFITESMGVLYADVTIPAVDATTTLIVEDVPFFSGALFADNDWVMMALIDRSGGGLTIARAWGQVSNYVDLGADANGVRRQQWTYTHRDGENDVGLVFKKGSIVMGWGQPGQGYIHHSVVDSGGSPYTRYATWSGANPYTPANRTIHTQIGNLESITDTTLEPTGYGLYGTNVFLKGDVIAANGLVALNSDGASIVTSTDWFASNRLSFLWQTLDGTEHAYVGSRSSDSIGYQLSLAAKGITSGGWGTIALRARTSAQSIESPNDSEGGTMLITPANVFIGPNRGVRIASTDDELATNVPGGELYAEVIHVFTLNATTIVGDTMSGQEWEFAGSMKIDANSASDTTVTIINEGAGRSDLNVDRNIIVGGTVDGVAVNALKGQFDSHIADANAHHAQVHPLTSANHTVSGLTAGQALLATSATTFAFGSYSHTNLTNVTADQHHNQVHVLATNSGLGADHTISGAATGHVLRATSATAAAFAQLQHSDLGGVTANQHHNQVHNIIGSDHTVAGSQFQLVGLTATNTPGLLTPSSNPGSAAAILRTGAAGDLTLKTLTVQGNVDITSGGDLTVGANVVFVDVSGQNVGINRAPDSQFDLDVAGALRATYLIGKHAIQLSGARMILHFDGQEPSNTNFTGELNGHMGQVATTSGAVIFRPGKFGKAVQVGEGTTNLIINPSFETSTGGWSSSWGDTITRSSEQAAYGDWSLKVTVNTTSSSGAWRSQTVTASLPYTFSAWIYIPSSWTGPVPSVRIFNGNDFNTLLALTNADNSIRDEWQRITVAATPTLTTIRIVVICGGVVTPGQFWYVDAAQLEQLPYATGYCDGSLPGHTWSGTAHNSTSSRAGARAQWASIGGSLPTTGWSLMFWIYSDAAYGLVDNQYVLELSGDGNNRVRIYQHTINPGVLRLAYSADGSTTFFAFAGLNTMAPGQWHHCVLSYDGVNLQSYLDGEMVQTLARSPFVVPASQLSIGALVDSDTNHTPTVLIDDLVILERAIPADEGRAVYESDAPTFAESSTFQFRVGNGLVWGDNEGLFARDEDGTAVFAVVGVDGKSWGGVPLGKGDVMIGNSTAGYLQFDRSAQSVSLVNTNLALFDGAVKFVETNPVDGIGIQTYTTQDINTNFTRAIAWWSNLNSKSGLPDVRLYGLRFNNDVTAGFQAFGDNVGGRQASVLIYAASRDLSESASLLLNESYGSDSNAQLSADLVQLSAGSASLSVSTGVNGTHITQTSTTAARPALSLSQADLSEEFIRFNGTVSAGNPIDTAALGTYYGKIRVSVNGTFRYLALYNS